MQISVGGFRVCRGRRGSRIWRGISWIPGQIWWMLCLMQGWRVLPNLVAWTKNILGLESLHQKSLIHTRSNCSWPCLGAIPEKHPFPLQICCMWGIMLGFGPTFSVNPQNPVMGTPHWSWMLSTPRDGILCILVQGKPRNRHSYSPFKDALERWLLCPCLSLRTGLRPG